MPCVSNLVSRTKTELQKGTNARKNRSIWIEEQPIYKSQYLSKRRHSYKTRTKQVNENQRHTPLYTELKLRMHVENLETWNMPAKHFQMRVQEPISLADVTNK